MSITNSSTITKVAAVAVAVVVMAGFLFGFAAPQAYAALTEAQIQSILSLLASFNTDQATINNVNASLRGQPTTGTPVASTACPYTWSTNLTTGSSGADVMKLQQFLNSDSATQVAASGVGSAGSETQTFGPL